MLRRDSALHEVRLRVLDAGLGPPNEPATPPTVEVARQLGLDLSDHVSTQVTADDLVNANLVIGMERHHVRELAVLAPEVWRRTYTLKEIVRRGEAIGARMPGEALDQWLDRVHDGRQRTDLLGASPLDDVADPTTDVTTTHEAAAAELQLLVARLVTIAW